MHTAIEVSALTKSYGSHPVLRELTFAVRQGEIFALLGTNGAGKTTALECIEGLRRPDSGNPGQRQNGDTAAVRHSAGLHQAAGGGRTVCPVA